MDSPEKGNGAGHGLSLREMSASWTPLRASTSNAPSSGGFPSAGASSSIGSTTQRWHDYDTAKAAEQALRQVLGAPQTDTTNWTVGLAKQRPMSGYHTPTAMMLHSSIAEGKENQSNGYHHLSATGTHTPIPPAWASGFMSPQAVASSFASRVQSIGPSGTHTPQLPTASSILGADFINRTFKSPTQHDEEQEMTTVNVMERLLQPSEEGVRMDGKDSIYLIGSQLNRKRGRKPGPFRRVMRGCLNLVGALIPVATVGAIGALAGRRVWRERRAKTERVAV